MSPDVRQAMPSLGLAADVDTYNALIWGCSHYGQNASVPKVGSLLPAARSVALLPSLFMTFLWFCMCLEAEMQHMLPAPSCHHNLAADLP